MRSILLVVALSLMACASEASQVAPTPEPQPGPTREPSVEERAEACAQAVESLPPDAEPQVAMRTVVGGCLSVYREAGCRAGMERAIAPETDASERIRVMSQACGEAYCPKLPDPKPAFCSPDVPADERAELFPAFREAMLDYELGMDGKRRVLDAFEAARKRREAAAPQ